MTNTTEAHRAHEAVWRFLRKTSRADVKEKNLPGLTARPPRDCGDFSYFFPPVVNIRPECLRVCPYEILTLRDTAAAHTFRALVRMRLPAVHERRHSPPPPPLPTAVVDDDVTFRRWRHVPARRTLPLRHIRRRIRVVLFTIDLPECPVRARRTRYYARKLFT